MTVVIILKRIEFENEDGVIGFTKGIPDHTEALVKLRGQASIEMS